MNTHSRWYAIDDVCFAMERRGMFQPDRRRTGIEVYRDVLLFHEWVRMAQFEALCESLIPPGIYCYSKTEPFENGVGRRLLDLCPFWSIREDKPEQENGFCRFLGRGDWENGGGGLVWDQCKECGVNEGERLIEELDFEAGPVRMAGHVAVLALARLVASLARFLNAERALNDPETMEGTTTRQTDAHVHADNAYREACAALGLESFLRVS